MNAVLLSLEAIATPIDWPQPETDLEDCLFAAATVVFVEPLRCDRERAALRNALGGQRFEHLLGLLTFVRKAHYWAMIHPDLAFDNDVRQMLNQHEELARLLLEDPKPKPERCSSQCKTRASALISKTGAAVRAVLYDEPERMDLGVADQPLDHRGAWRPIVGHP